MYFSWTVAVLQNRIQLNIIHCHCHCHGIVYKQPFVALRICEKRNTRARVDVECQQVSSVRNRGFCFSLSERIGISYRPLCNLNYETVSYSRAPRRTQERARLPHVACIRHARLVKMHSQNARGRLSRILACSSWSTIAQGGERLLAVYLFTTSSVLAVVAV